MKKLLPLFIICILGATGVQAQSGTKIGFANVDYIFGKMPESKKIEADLQALQTQLKKTIDEKANEFKVKFEAYNKAMQEGTMLPAVRQNTERELQQLNDNLQKLQEDAQVNIQQKSQELMIPVYQRVGEAIEKVATENGFDLILTDQIGEGIDVILYGNEKLNISDLVLQKLVPAGTAEK